MIYEDGVLFHSVRVNEFFLFMNKLFTKVDNFSGICEDEVIEFSYSDTVYPVEI